MESLSQAQVEAIKKLSSIRLMGKLSSVGYSEEEIENMSRDSMLNIWAECVAAGKDQPVEAGAAVTPQFTGYDVELERERMEFEKEKFERKLEFEKQKFEIERKEKNSVIMLLKRYGEAMKASITPMGPEMLDVVLFFRHIEAMFNRYKVPENLQAALLQPYLNSKSRSVVARIDPLFCNDYKAVRDAILKEHKLSPSAYLEMFNSLSRSPGETTVMYCSKLKSLLSMYVESRQVDTFDALVSLIICDRVKSTLSENCLRHVLSVEAASARGWMQTHQLAECVDLYRANHFDNDKPRASAIGEAARSVGGHTGGFGRYKQQPPPPPQPHKTTGRAPGVEAHPAKPMSAGGLSNSSVICYKCRQSGHTRKNCPQNSNLQNTQVKSANACTSVPAAAVLISETPVVKPDIQAHNAGEVSCNKCDAYSLCASHLQPSDVQAVETVNVDVKSFNACDFVPLQYVTVTVDELSSESNVVNIDALEDSGSEINIIKSSFVESIVLPKVGSVQLRGIVGAPIQAELVKLHVSLVDDSRVSTNDCTVPIVCAVCPNLNEDMILTSALVKQLQCMHGNNAECEHGIVTRCDVVRSDCDVDVTTGDNQGQTDSNENTEVMQTESEDVCDSLCDNDSTQDGNVNVDIFRAEQQGDESLKSCWDMAKRGKGGYVVRNGLLYRNEKIDSLGETCSQLCLPVSRRKAVLDLAHCTIGCHQAYRRTRDRIRLSFFWPTITADTKKFCGQCETCQKAARVTVWDRTPITAVPRAQYAFQVMYADCAGPLFPNQKTSAYNYFIVLCDSATSFPFAYPLRSLTAKNIADALIKTWTLTGVPETLIWDNAAPHKSELMREMMKRMGCVPRFSTPYYPQGHSAAERLISTVKSMINKVAADKPKQWHLYLDFILWAIRESENASLGVAPWTLVFSRLPRGPLNVLKETWEGTVESPLRLGKNTVEFLRDLQGKLETVQQYAQEHHAQASERYVRRYNERAREKSFTVGDRVLLLSPDSAAGRTFSRWRGPAKIVEVKSPHSYIIELDGARHHVHANRLKQFLVSSDVVTCRPDFETACTTPCAGMKFDSDHFDLTVNENVGVNECMSCGCAVVSDCDSEFGEIHAFEQFEQKPVLLPSQKIEPHQIAHLSPSEQQALLGVLDKFPECFSDDPGLCTLVQHGINLTSEFKPKRLKAYRVPERLKPQVSKEIQNMLDLGIIRPSNSDMVSPLVVVLKGPGGRDGIRLAVDYSYVNSFARSDPYPVPDIDAIMNRIGSASLISTFDAALGYFQTPVRPGDEPLTAFICDDGIFEFLRTPFGGKTCGSTFIRAVQQVLKPVGQFTESFVDDMVVHTHASNGNRVFEAHLAHIERFLQRIKEAGMTLKLRKCKFAQAEVKFCGKIVGSGGKRPDPERVAAIQSVKPARTKTEVRRLLGVFGFFRDHIPNYAALAKPLTDLTTKHTPNLVPWTDVHTESLNTLKQALCEAAERRLNVVDFNRPFNIKVDASDSAVAGYLSQFGENGLEHPLAFFSIKLNGSQKAWATVHKEAYAVIAALRKFRNWVFLNEIHVFSDHNPLTFLTSAAPKNAKLMRWSLALQEFNIHFHYIRGKNNVVPDCLSRLNLDG